jgi:hypothetical protein
MGDTISSNNTSCHTRYADVDCSWNDSFFSLWCNFLQCAFDLLFHTDPFIHEAGDSVLGAVVGLKDRSSGIADCCFKGCGFISDEFSRRGRRVVDGWLR